MIDFRKFQEAEENKAKMSGKVPLRSEVKVENTWDLAPLFRDDDAWEKAFAEAQAFIAEMAAAQGKMREGAAELLEIERQSEKVGRRVEALYVYASMKSDQDAADSRYSAMKARMGQFLSRLSAASSWYRPELVALTDEQLEAYYKEEPALLIYRRHHEDTRRARRHMLSEAEEKLLARAGEVIGSGGKVFSVLDNADQKFPAIKDEKGEEIEITHGRFGKLMENRDRRVRKDTFEGLYSTYRQYRNTYAATLAANVKAHNFNAEVRGFANARAAALFGNDVPEKVYDQLLQTVNGRLSLLHRYTALRRQLLKLDEIHSYDLYVPAIPDIDLEYSLDEAKEIVLKATAVLGADYTHILEEAFSSRWLDTAENQGKRSGAYSGGCYDSAPYILMTWKGTLDNLYTLAHELGHSCHSWLTRKNQPYVYGNYPIFLAEIASTTNENLLTQYLMDTLEDDTAKRYVMMHYLDGFKGTVFRQTQFADFEHLIHQADQQGTALTADWLCGQYADMNQRYYGPDLARDESISLEWARIPHFYYDYYVFQYATGFSAATAFSRRILSEGREAVEQYLGFLKSGSSQGPIDTLLTAGLDMSTEKPISDALDRFESVLEQMEETIN